jgi:hypothetical protein
MKVYDVDNQEVGEAPNWLQRYAAVSPMPGLNMARELETCRMERVLLQDRDEAGDPVGEPRRALRLKDAASLAVFQAILDDEAKRTERTDQDA